MKYTIEATVQQDITAVIEANNEEQAESILNQLVENNLFEPFVLDTTPALTISYIEEQADEYE